LSYRCDHFFFFHPLFPSLDIACTIVPPFRPLRGSPPSCARRHLQSLLGPHHPTCSLVRGLSFDFKKLPPAAPGSLSSPGFSCLTGRVGCFPNNRRDLPFFLTVSRWGTVSYRPFVLSCSFSYAPGRFRCFCTFSFLAFGDGG